MTNESETPASTPKRARIQNPPVEPPPTAPSSAAQAAVSYAVASYPKPFKAIALSISKAFNALKSRARQQALTRVRLAVADFIPHSARIKFQVKASESAMENDRFTALRTDMEAKTAAYQKACKEAIMEVGLMEYEAIEREMVKLFCTSAAWLAKLCLLEANPTNSDPRHFAFALFCIEKDDDNVLSKHLPCTRAQLFACFNEHNDNGADQHIPGNTSAALVESFTAPLLSRLHSLLHAIFVKSWEAQTAIYLQQERENALAKQVKEYMGGQATVATATIIDAEITVDPKTLRNLIQTQIDSKTKSLRTELQQLRQTVKRSNPKDRGGANQPSASSKKKKVPQEKKKKAKPKQKRNESDDSDASNEQDTPRGRPASRKKAPKGKQQKKSGASKPRAKQRSAA